MLVNRSTLVGCSYSIRKWWPSAEVLFLLQQRSVSVRFVTRCSVTGMGYLSTIAIVISCQVSFTLLFSQLSLADQR